MLALLDAIGSPATVASAGGRYFGFVTGGSLPAALAANWLAGAWDQNPAPRSSRPSPRGSRRSRTQWMLDVLGLPRNCGTGFVTGATMANVTALAAARHALLRTQAGTSRSDGLFGAPPITVVVGEEVHVTLLKALGLLGLGRDRVVRVPVDGQGRMRADALPPLDDPHHRLHPGRQREHRRLRSRGCDRAAGATCRRVGARRWRVRTVGRSRAGAAASARRGRRCGLVGDRRAQVAQRAVRQRRGVRPRAAAPAQRDGDVGGVPPDAARGATRTHYTPEMSRRARGVEVWAALRSLGREGLADLVERTCRHASRFADGLRAAGYDDPERRRASTRCSCRSAIPRRRAQVIAAVQADGTCWCGGTMWQGRTAMRISVSSWATTDDDVERSLTAIVRVAKGVGRA